MGQEGQINPGTDEAVYRLDRCDDVLVASKWHGLYHRGIGKSILLLCRKSCLSRRFERFTITMTSPSLRVVSMRTASGIVKPGGEAT